MNAAAVVSLLVGLCLLIFGRKLFWLTGAAIGFVVTMAFAQQFLGGSSSTLHVIIAVVAGLLGAAVALFVQRAAIFILGFLAGGFFLMNITGNVSAGIPVHTWIFFVIGGVLGALIVSFLFEWALIVVSSLAGSVLVTHALDPERSGGSLLVAVLCAVGVLIQARLKGTGKTKKERHAPVEPKKEVDA